MRSTSPLRIMILLALGLGGCVTAYRSDLPENLTFSSPGLRGGFLRSREVSLNIFFASDRCEMDFQGAVRIRPGGEAPKMVGLPVGRFVYARIYYSDKGFLSNTTKHRSHEFRFRPQSGYRYDIEYETTSNAYELRLHQTDVASGRRSTLPVGDWDDCSPLRARK